MVAPVQLYLRRGRGRRRHRIDRALSVSILISTDADKAVIANTTTRFEGFRIS